MKTITLDLRMKHGYNHTLGKPYSENYKEKVQYFVETDGFISLGSDSSFILGDPDIIIGKIKSVTDTTATVDIYSADVIKKLNPVDDYVLCFSILANVRDDIIDIHRIVGGFIDAKLEADRKAVYPTPDSTE